jgi:predicted nuclease of predicted toxin-antitoxin system
LKLKLDENLPVALAPILRQHGHDVHTTIQEDLHGASDTKIWSTCQFEKRLLVTQDLDFSDSRRFEPGTHFGLVLLRLPHYTRQQLKEAVDALFQLPEVLTWDRCVVVVNRSRIRVKRPPDSHEAVDTDKD